MSEGLIPRVRRLLYGAPRTPKAVNVSAPRASTPTTSVNYEAMPIGYRWFRQNELVRKCTVSNAYFAAMSAGFETELQGPTEDFDLDQYAHVKEKIDAVNKRVNLDLILFTAQVKRSIYGKTGFEIVPDDEDDLPARLLPLDSTKLTPKVKKDWTLTGFDYKGRNNLYKPEDLLYFLNLSLNADYEGLSDVEPIQDVCNSRHELLGENFKEIVRTLWAPHSVYKVDTSGLSKEDAEKALKDLIPTLRAGKSTAVSETVDVTVVNMTPDMRGLTMLLEQLKQAIIANYGTPRFLLGEPIENRATAYAEFEAYIQGPITHIQRYFKREIERNWYDPMTRGILSLGEDEPLPMTVKHNWNIIRITDVYEMAKAVAVLYSRGEGIIRDIPQKGYDMLGWPRKEIEDLKALMPPQEPEPKKEEKPEEEEE